MKMTLTSMTDWVRKLSETKPYRMMVKNGAGFYEIMFLYNEYHYSDRIFTKDMEDELICQKKILEMCSVFESNIKLRSF